MLIKFIPLFVALALPTCKKQAEVVGTGSSSSAASPAASVTSAGANGAAAPAAGAPATTNSGAKGKIAVDQTAQVIIYGFHRFVNTVRRPDTEITPQDFEKEMQMLKDKGITVISMQDLLAWKRGEKNIPARAAVITFDDGWKSQYEVAWPIMKKFNYPLTLFIYTEGIRGGKFGGGEAMTWEMLGEMRDAGVDIEGHSATHQDLKRPYDKVTKRRLTPPEYQQWLESEIVAPKQLLEQRLGIKVNCFAVPYGLWNEQVKEAVVRAGYEAMFTVYGQPITFRTNNDLMGRYLIEGNKPKVFSDAIASIGGAGGGTAGVPVAEIGSISLQTKPADGETVHNALPLISANLSAFGKIDANSAKMRISGRGVVPASFDPKTNVLSYQMTQRITD
ncbi:MAG: polysaccharide deacetylase family protein, partial [Verrucomicrobiota bacterium]|nr:polysaccharide deacetylase family protein [Verrucomicrobiota bacterium]